VKEPRLLPNSPDNELILFRVKFILIFFIFIPFFYFFKFFKPVSLFFSFFDVLSFITKYSNKKKSFNRIDVLVFVIEKWMKIN
jgi:hypothetical protein